MYSEFSVAIQFIQPYLTDPVKIYNYKIWNTQSLSITQVVIVINHIH